MCNGQSVSLLPAYVSCPSPVGPQSLLDSPSVTSFNYLISGEAAQCSESSSLSHLLTLSPSTHGGI
jgi:hypothetical protein